MITGEKGGMVSIEPLGSGIYKIEVSGRDWLHLDRLAGVRLLLDDDELCDLISDLEKARRTR